MKMKVEVYEKKIPIDQILLCSILATGYTGGYESHMTANRKRNTELKVSC